LSQSVLIL